MRRLLPTAADVSIDEAYRGPLGAVAGRPWVGLCMVASIDGSTVVDGESTALSSTNDSGVLHRLRELADVIVVGAGTVRGEGYGEPRKDGQRVGVVTGSGAVDTTTDLFTSGAGFLITTESADLGDAGDVDVLRAGAGDAVDLGAAIARFGEIHPRPVVVQAEGGPQLNGALLDADLIDEINVTTSPLCVGGDGPRLAVDATDVTLRYELAQLVVDDDGFVFCRWRRRRSLGSIR